MSKTGKFRFSIDRGGTFTDVFAQCPSGSVRTYKLLSKNDRYQDAPTEGIRRIIEMESGKELPPTEPIDSSLIESIRMGTTVATNALLERKGERTGLLITKGFRDLLHIGNQARPNIFDLSIAIPDHLYCEVVEVDERVVLESPQCELNLDPINSIQKQSNSVNIVKSLDLKSIENDLRNLLEKGIKSIAVVLMHSWVYDEHEKKIMQLALSLGFKHCSISSSVIRMMRIVPRGFTTTADSYTTPLIKEYLHSFKSGFSGLTANQVLFMQSDGGLTNMNRFCGSRAVLSGPAGGVVGYARTVYDKYKIPVIGFDMGGTSTDVSRFDGEFIHTFESITAGVPLQCPQLDIQTVAAGGGSILSFTSGIYNVGPESAGANPGPVAYDHGGKQLTITDANLMLNRLLPSRFPKIFGPSNDSELNGVKTVEKFKSLQSQINEFNKQHGMEEVSIENIALGFIRVANETMARPIRNITQGKGFDPSTHMLACFGGAGGQHACAIAKSLGIKQVSVPRYAGILSAVGIFLADVVIEENEPVGSIITEESYDRINSHVIERFESICSDLEKKLKSEGNYTEIKFEKYLNIRYNGTDCALMVRDEPPVKNFATKFIQEYSRQFGFQLQRELVLDDIRVRGVGVNEIIHENNINEKANSSPLGTINAYFETGSHATPYHDCVPGTYVGPCLILDNLSTIVVEPGWVATITDKDVNLQFQHAEVDESKRSVKLDSIMLSIFSHRFMSIAEQMGRILQRTSVSTNIKERLDFSCAIFGPDGGLVSNAPHIPVHLGAMQEAVQYQMRLAHACHCLKCGGKRDQDCMVLLPGDVLLSNHPVAGGSHLPDLTVITPVFQESDSKSPIFFVANRGHHADIGGITPGSMPPNSKSINEEGAVFRSFKLVREGTFMEDELVAELMKPAQYPGSSGTRNLSDNLSDLRAQVAANQKGIALLTTLINEYTLNYVQTYMRYIQENAEVSVREMLKTVAMGYSSELEASDYMDDGSEICLKVSINQQEGSAIFDFTGTSYQVIGNCNAPKAITLSAVIYCIRCLVGRDIPLNQGCLKPIKIIIPEGSILHPSEDAAVVGGNVLTSQRVVDVILKAFSACAASQGCMNNITFGDTTLGYYETVAGGAGAGPDWHGRSGVHTHMTNTRITDPEILELRYPVLLNHFSLEEHSGGDGKFRGGDGVRREILFRKSMHLSVLTERRVFTPYGLNGGGDGKRGKNFLVKNAWNKSTRTINLGGKTSVDTNPGDMFVLISPGGGGWGKADS
ncbi:unnamed protein product [Orchesella dallaii]|uniref:5-oxoprolinase n=1 Tax=Orchesella dallaii TaxID=48710 RepID=A0ABP1PKK6_9HEXA